MFDKVKRIVDGDFMPTTVDFEYGYDHQRIRMTTTYAAGMTIEKHYFGNCEVVDFGGSREDWTYLSGPLGVFAVVKTIDNNTPSLHYILKDHLGSWTTITDANGNVVCEQSFDAWGNMRDPETWSGSYSAALMFDRGYTGHEHLNSFGLINMNGRMYDPVMSSFLSVDNYVQCPDFSQNFNRYAYCLNNPLKYTDPSGEELCLLAAVGIAAVVNVTMNGINNLRYGESFFHGAGQAAVVGAVQGLFTYGIGESANAIGLAIKNQATAHLAKAGFQLVAHGTMGGMSTMSRGGKFWQGFVSSATASVMSTAINQTCIHFQLSAGQTRMAMIAGGALSGGISAKMAGGDFIDGFCNGLICAGLNHAMHWVAKNVTGPDDPPGKQNTRASTGNKNVAKLKEDLMKGGQAGGGVATAVNGASELSKMTRLAQFSKSLGGAFVVVSEIPDAIDFVNVPSLGTGTKLLIGVGLGVATVFGGPVVATGAFVLGVVNAYGGFDSYYDQLNNLNIHDTQNTK